MFEVEPNDTFATAMPVTFVDDTAAIKSEYDAGNGVDEFSFTTNVDSGAYVDVRDGNGEECRAGVSSTLEILDDTRQAVDRERLKQPQRDAVPAVPGGLCLASRCGDISRPGDAERRGRRRTVLGTHRPDSGDVRH